MSQTSPAAQSATAEPARLVAVVGAAIVDCLPAPTRLLGARRTEPASLAGGWELPGGKVDPGEDERSALEREIREELGVGIVLGDELPGPMPDGRWPLGSGYAMRVWLAAVTGGRPRPVEDHDELRWLGRDDLWDVPWLPGDIPPVRAVEGILTWPGGQDVRPVVGGPPDA